jgi:hypothetical protein
MINPCQTLHLHISRVRFIGFVADRAASRACSPKDTLELAARLVIFLKAVSRLTTIHLSDIDTHSLVVSYEVQMKFISMSSRFHSSSLSPPWPSMRSVGHLHWPRRVPHGMHVTSWVTGQPCSPRLPTLHPGTIPSDQTDSTHSILGGGLRLWFITCADGASLWRSCHGRPAPLQ